jgi:molybdopterin molybdotransferase
MEISTGGVVPEGADAVVPVEYVVRHDNNSVEFVEPVASGANVRPRGGDASAGAVVVDGGVVLGPVQIGALAAAGVAEVECTRRPRVAVLATGTELARPGEPLGPGQVYEANAVMLAAALAAAGAEVEQLPAVADDEAAHRAAIARGLDADVLVTSGGVSVGPHDLVRAIEAELGVEEIFWRVAMRPGKPVSFGVRGATLVFGLPGNPVSSLVGCALFVAPAVRALQGVRDPLPPFADGVLASPLRRNPGRDDFVRARMRSDGNVTTLEPVVGQESHMIARAASANALVHIARGDGEVAAGDRVAWLALH